MALTVPTSEMYPSPKVPDPKSNWPTICIRLSVAGTWTATRGVNQC